MVSHQLLWHSESSDGASSTSMNLDGLACLYPPLFDISDALLKFVSQSVSKINDYSFWRTR